LEHRKYGEYKDSFGDDKEWAMPNPLYKPLTATNQTPKHDIKMEHKTFVPL